MRKDYLLSIIILFFPHQAFATNVTMTFLVNVEHRVTNYLLEGDPESEYDTGYGGDQFY